MTFILHDQVRCWTIRDHVRSSPAVQQGEITTRAFGTRAIWAVPDVQSPNLLGQFCHKDNDFILFSLAIVFFFLLPFQNIAEVPESGREAWLFWTSGGKKSYSRIQHEFSDLLTWLKTPKQRAWVAANQQNDLVSGYNGCMCFSGMSWSPSALSVKHEWNSRC